MSKGRTTPSKAGCLTRLVFTICLLAALLLGLLLVVVAVPQDLSDIGGYGQEATTAEVRDLTGVLEQSVMRGHPVTLSEEEINLWLGRELSMQQDGLMSGVVGVKRVWVRLLPDEAEVIFEREVFGWPLTLSMFLQVRHSDTGEGVKKHVDLHGGPFSEGMPGILRGGRFGSLVVPQGYLHLIKAGHEALAEACQEEVHLAFDEMMGIQIEDGQLVLNPRQAPVESPSLR